MTLILTTIGKCHSQSSTAKDVHIKRYTIRIDAKRFPVKSRRMSRISESGLIFISYRLTFWT